MFLSQEYRRVIRICNDLSWLEISASFVTLFLQTQKLLSDLFSCSQTAYSRIIFLIIPSQLHTEIISLIYFFIFFQMSDVLAGNIIFY